MFKIFIWRLIYHCLCLAKALGYRGRSVKYFAYGANLDPEVLKKRNIEPLSRREYLLRDFELKFNHKIPFKDAAMASLEPSAGNYVPGVLYTIYRIDELRLDCMESHIVFNRYGKCRLDGGKSIDTFFFYKTNCAEEGLKPTKAYVAKILSGYQLMRNVSPKFLEYLTNVEVIEGFSPKDPPEFLLRNYDILTPLLRNLLVKYDKICVKIFASLIFKPSIFEPILDKKQNSSPEA